jgi:hypothetical protein
MALNEGGAQQLALPRAHSPRWTRMGRFSLSMIGLHCCPRRDFQPQGPQSPSIVCQAALALTLRG